MLEFERSRHRWRRSKSQTKQTEGGNGQRSAISAVVHQHERAWRRTGLSKFVPSFSCRSSNENVNAFIERL
jgi:hypothetical protein